MIQHRQDRGRLHRIYRGVYAVGHRRLTLRGRWMAAVLACGDGAVLSHRDAAALHDLRRAGAGKFDVTAPKRHNIGGIRCHWVRTLHPDDVTQIDGIPTTALERTLLDLAGVLTPRQLANTLEQAQRADVLDFRRISATLARSPGRHGMQRLNRALTALADDPPWTQSETERAFLRLTNAAGLPVPQTNVYIEGELVDAWWPQHNLVVEVDGWNTHKTRRSFESDRRRDVILVKAGIRVVRFTYPRVMFEPDAVARDLAQLLARDPSTPPRG